MFNSKPKPAPSIEDKMNGAHSNALHALSAFRDTVAALEDAAATLDEVEAAATAEADRHAQIAEDARGARDEHLSTAKAISDLIGGVR